jgi:hypothetical protein
VPKTDGISAIWRPVSTFRLCVSNIPTGRFPTGVPARQQHFRPNWL